MSFNRAKNGHCGRLFVDAVHPNNLPAKTKLNLARISEYCVADDTDERFAGDAAIATSHKDEGGRADGDRFADTIRAVLV
jgi:hypothetical protein